MLRPRLDVWRMGGNDDGCGKRKRVLGGDRRWRQARHHLKHFFQIDSLISGSVFRLCLDPGDADRSQRKEDSQIMKKLPKIHEKKYILLQGLSLDADKLRLDTESLPFSLESQHQHHLSGIHEGTCHGPNTSYSSSSASPMQAPRLNMRLSSHQAISTLTRLGISCAQ